ncbi:MAG: hypothetical protein CL608_05640 [Anaerolineaceae bacterium]|nr:hypothetical protein [Anaerolineaceae bacterium]
MGGRVGRRTVAEGVDALAVPLTGSVAVLVGIGVADAVGTAVTMVEESAVTEDSAIGVAAGAAWQAIKHRTSSQSPFCLRKNMRPL